MDYLEKLVDQELGRGDPRSPEYHLGMLDACATNSHAEVKVLELPRLRHLPELCAKKTTGRQRIAFSTRRT